MTFWQGRGQKFTYRTSTHAAKSHRAREFEQVSLPFLSIAALPRAPPPDFCAYHRLTSSTPGDGMGRMGRDHSSPASPTRFPELHSSSAGGKVQP